MLRSHTSHHRLIVALLKWILCSPPVVWPASLSSNQFCLLCVSGSCPQALLRRGPLGSVFSVEYLYVASCWRDIPTACPSECCRFCSVGVWLSVLLQTCMTSFVYVGLFAFSACVLKYDSFSLEILVTSSFVELLRKHAVLFLLISQRK